MAVRVLRSAPSEHVEDLAYLMARLKGDPQASELATGVEPAWTSLRAQIEDWDAKRHAVQEAQTSLKILSRVVDNAVRVAHGAILDALDRNRHSPKFLTFFPRGLVAVYRASYQDKLTMVRSIAETCTRESDPKILQQAELLRAAADPLDAAFRRRSETRVAESAAYGQLQTRKIEAMNTCRWIGLHLTGLFPFNHERVRTFFRVNYCQPSSPAPEKPAALATVETPPAEVKLAS